MPSELVKTFTQSGGLMRTIDIGFLFNSKIDNDDIEYILQYIEDNADSVVPIHMDSMISIARRILSNNDRIEVARKFINEESIWTPYLLGVGLEIGKYFPDKLELYRKYSYQIHFIVSTISRSILGSLQTYDFKSGGQTRTFYKRLAIKCYIDDLDYLTLNRLDLMMDSLLTFRDKYELSKFLFIVFELKDINDKMKECLNSFIIEFCDPTKRRYYSSAFLRGLYENMGNNFRFNFHNYVETLFEQKMISSKDFLRYDKAYLESAEI